MFRLAHISDIHLSPLPPIKWYHLFSKRITGYLNWKLNRKHHMGVRTLEPLIEHLSQAKADHVVVTGDLVNLSLKREFARAREFLDDLGTPESVSALCGNHDAYVPGSLRYAIKSWEPYVTSDDETVTSWNTFPYLRVRGDVALIGCNSAEATLPFFATGYFRRKQAKRLAKILDATQGLCRVVMIHHPPIARSTLWHKRLIGTKRFQKIIAKHGAELILHGHTHLATRNEITGPDGPVPVMCVPAAGNGLGGHRPAGRYNIFEIENRDNEWSIQWKAYGLSEKTAEIELLEEASL